MTCQTPNSQMVALPINSLQRIASEPHHRVNRPRVVACAKQLLLLTSLAIQFLLVVAFTAGIGVGQTTSATDNGIPSGLAQGSLSKDLDYVR